MREFKVGDEVKDVRFGYGEVIAIIKSSDCPINVRFTEGNSDYYLNGKIIHNDPYRSLFHADEEIIVPRPKKKVRIQGWACVFEHKSDAEICLNENPISFVALTKSPIPIDTEIEVEE